MERQLGQVRAQLKALDMASKQNALDKLTDPLRRQRLELQLQRDRLMLSKAALDKTGGASRKAGGDAGFFIRQLHDLLHIAQIVEGAFERLGRGAVAMGRQVLDAVSFRETSLVGFQSLFGDKGGIAQFEKMTSLAVRLGRPIKEIVAQAQALGNTGIIASDIAPMLTLAADLDAMGGGGGDKLLNAIQSAFAEGKATSGTVEMLRGSRLNPDTLFKTFGKGNLLAGKAILNTQMGIDPATFTQTALQAVLDLEGGKMGSKAAQRAQTPDSMIQSLTDRAEQMFSRLSGSGGIKAFKGVLKNLTDILNPESASGRKMLGRLDQLSSLLGRALEPLTGPEGKARMEAFFGAFAKLLGEVIPLLELAARYTEILVRFGAGDRAAGAPTSVGEEMSQLQDWARNNRLVSYLFVRDKKSPGPPQPTPYQQLSAPIFNVNVDARGSTKEDAHHIARTIADTLEKAAQQKGAIPP